MKKIIALLSGFVLALLLISSRNSQNPKAYFNAYSQSIAAFKNGQSQLVALVKTCTTTKPADIERVREAIHQTRLSLKNADLWLRYLEPLAYKKINSPLPVEWETEVFEKFEKPYKRIGGGLTLAELYLDEETINKDTLLSLLSVSLEATSIFEADSIVQRTETYHHFYLCNRLWLLNLAAIYTTGFECPDTMRIIPEMENMLQHTAVVNAAFNESFPDQALSPAYMERYNGLLQFVKAQPRNYTQFDHFTFLKEYINPLYSLNQELIRLYKVSSKSNIDYSLNKQNTSIFNKDLYYGQNPKGLFLRVKDPQVLAEIDRVGKLLFYDPILSGNNQRSCASCHKPTEFLTDTVHTTALQFDHQGYLPRNTPSLLNAEYNHLLMMDGKHISLQNQGKGVITSPVEMGGNEAEVLRKVLSCNEYKKALQKLLAYTPQEKEITLEHITSAITFYYSKFSRGYAPFDEAMDQNKPVGPAVQLGFNVFMGKAQCATCHFVPQFNGVKPSYIGSEFEVLGVPADKKYSRPSGDKGRYEVNPAEETLNAFRTGTVRNSAHTQPYMHNGVFNSLDEVIDFYDGGGGAGRGLQVGNQTLSSDSLHLSKADKQHLIAFINALTEKIDIEQAPAALPVSKIKALNSRKVGGEY